MTPTSHHFVAQRLRLHYVDWGNPAAPPLVLVHGGRDHARSWDWVAADLARDWHVVAPDLRGHGDSEGPSDGHYAMSGYVYDLAQLVHSLDRGPVTLVAHSLGGNIALRYAALYPAMVTRIVAIEGLGPSPAMRAQREATPVDDRLRTWIDEVRALGGRQPKRYATIADACARMMAENPRLTAAQAEHLTRHGVRRNEDGSFGWKFDNYLRAWPPADLSAAEMATLWSRITAPALLVYGADSWASNPAEDGRLAALPTARVERFDRAGHWVHHDRTADFIAAVRAFLGEPR